MRSVDPFLAEFEHETATTRRLLGQVPEDKFGFRPHEKAMSLGELCGHVAEIPGTISEILKGDSFDVAEITGPAAAPTSRAELLARLDENARKGQAFLNDLDDARATAAWRLMRGDEELMSLPRIAAVRSFLFNHLYHHRGQVSTYLRIVGAYVPAVYGPTADENPFA